MSRYTTTLPFYLTFALLIPSSSMADSMPPTVHESFQQILPDLQLPPSVYEEAPISGNTTRSTDPPKVLVPAPVAEWTRRADTLLNQYRRAHSMNSRLPAVERSFHMNTEADVVRATTLYVLHPINQAINAMYGNAICCFAEHSTGPVRCDFVWKYFDGQNWHSLAILEMKRRGILRNDDFASAFARVEDVQEKVWEAYAKAGENKDPTHLTNNAVMLSKQAAAYALRYRTQFIAIFDWDSLFLYRFRDLRAEEETVGDWAYGTWVREEEGFRKALLGLLVRACQLKLS